MPKRIQYEKFNFISKLGISILMEKM